MINDHTKLNPNRPYYYTSKNKYNISTPIVVVYFFKVKFVPTNIVGLFHVVDEREIKLGPINFNSEYEATWFESFSEMIKYINSECFNYEKYIYVIDTMTKQPIRLYRKGKL